MAESQFSLEHIRLVQLVSPFQVKRSVIISATVVALSAIAHSAILWLPLPGTGPKEETLSAAQPRGEEIAVVILPGQEAPAEPPPQVIEPTPLQSVVPASTEPAALLPTDVTPQAASPQSQLPSVPTTPQVPAAESPAADDLPIDEGDPAPVFTPPENDGPLLSYGDGFPHAAGAISGCFGLTGCQRVPNTDNFRNVGRNLVAALRAQGYKINLRDEFTEAGRNVYALIAPDSSDEQFLTIFSSTEDGSAIYIMSAEPLTLDELRLLSASVGDDHPLI